MGVGAGAAAAKSIAPLLAKMATSAAVSQGVSNVTGNPMLGTAAGFLAGGAMGGGSGAKGVTDLSKLTPEEQALFRAASQRSAGPQAGLLDVMQDPNYEAAREMGNVMGGKPYPAEGVSIADRTPLGTKIARKAEGALESPTTQGLVMGGAAYAGQKQKERDEQAARPIMQGAPGRMRAGRPSSIGFDPFVRQLAQRRRPAAGMVY